MAFPTVVSVTPSSHDTAVTNHTVTLPTFASGELAIIFPGINGGSDSGTFPGGWTKATGSGAGANNIAACWVYRVCTGSEGASITFTTGSAFRSAHLVYRIQSHNSSTNIPEGQDAGSNSGTDAAPNVTVNTPTGGAKDYLWLHGVMTDSGLLCTTTDGNFTDLTTHQSGTTANLSVGASGAQRNLNAASLDPGAFTLSGAEGWLAYCVAIHPGSEGTPAGGGADVVDPMGMMGFFGG